MPAGVKVGITCRLFLGIVFLTSRYLPAAAAPLPAENPQIEVLINFEGGSVGKVEQVSLTYLRCAVKGQSDPDHRNGQANRYRFEVTNLPHRPMTDLDGGADGGGRFNLKQVRP